MVKLSDNEQRALVDLCTMSSIIKTEEQFQEWVRNYVRPFFPFGRMLAVLGSLHGETICIERMIGVDYPHEVMMDIQRRSRLSDRMVVARWYKEREPQIIDKDAMAQLLSPFELAEAEKYELQNLAVHGLVDIQGHKGSYFSFSQIPQQLSVMHARKMKLMIPQLHQVICNLHARSAEELGRRHDVLSTREQEILHLIAQGRTNRDIAMSLHRSERTINNHVHAILSKLGVANRTEAASRLMQIG